MFIYRLRDNVAESFLAPILHDNDAVAIRSLSDALRQEEQFFDRAQDFSLYCVGTEDRISGRLTPCDPKHVIDVSEIKSSLTEPAPSPSPNVSPSISEIKPADLSTITADDVAAIRKDL